MKHMVRLAMLAAIILTAMLPVDAQASGFRVIVHADNPATQIQSTTLRKMMLENKSRWDQSGLSVEPVDLDRNSQVREEFSRSVLGKSVSSILNYWQRQIFSGANSPPVEAASDAEVVAFVAANPGGVGYVSNSAQLNGVKVIPVVE